MKMQLITIRATNIDDGSCNNYLNTTDNAIWEDPDTLFWHDHNKSYIFANEDDAENFSWNEDYDEGILARPLDGETDSDLLDLVTNFSGIMKDTLGAFTIYSNGVNTFDWDENPDPSVPDTNWYHSCIFMVYRCKSSC